MSVSNRFSLSPRDNEILDALSRRIRVLSIPQIARVWFGNTSDPHRQVRRRLITLEQAGLIKMQSVSARPELTLDRPLVTWTPGDPTPDHERIAYLLEARWREPAVLTNLVIATRGAGSARGGSGGRWPRRSEVSHDLTLAGLYLVWSVSPEARSGEWISEARLRQEGWGEADRLPDAMIDIEGRRRVIELGGLYGAAKLQDFHWFCAERKLPYELW